ncbi:unnamed protein product, partial [marine sediment metagenome]
LGALWARQKIEHLMNQDWSGIQRGSPRTEIKEEIIDLGLKFRLVTQFTSFVAVEWMVITEGGEARTVPVPVAMPEGVTYEGVFGQPASRLTRGRGWYGAGGMAGGYGGAYGGAGMAGPAGAPGPTVALEQSAGPEVSGWIDYRLGLAEPTGMTPEEKREFRLEHRLAEELHGLAEKVASEGQDGNLTVGDIEVKGGLVEVAIWLTDDSEENLAKLKELGFQVMGQAKSVKMLIGKLPVDKLEEVAQLDFVRLVEPAPTSG